MSENQSLRQVSLAGAASGSKKRPSKKTKKSNKRLRFILIPIVLVVVLLIALFARGCGSDTPNVTVQDTLQYTVTPDELAGKVSYFALGVLGENATDRMDMVAVMCYDRKAKAISVMQMPVMTYLGEDGSFATSILGDVWGNPKAITWCDTCRGRVAADTADGEMHKPCGSKLTTRKGSAFTDFARVFNSQYGLPIDNYLVIPRDGLIKLIDAVGGVDMTMNKKVSIDGIAYEKGVRTLTGKAAVYYATEYEYKDTPATDLERMGRQRELFASLLNHLSERSLKDMYNNDPKLQDVLSNVMLGSDPIRYDSSSFGKARLINVGDHKAENTKSIEAMAKFFFDISRIDLENVTYCILPGTAVKRGTNTVYSVNKAQTVSLLNEVMNPCDLLLDDTTVTVNELKTNPKDADTCITTLDKVLVSPQ